jgi:hypothetical protein
MRRIRGEMDIRPRVDTTPSQVLEDLVTILRNQASVDRRFVSLLIAKGASLRIAGKSEPGNPLPGSDTESKQFFKSSLT